MSVLDGNPHTIIITGPSSSPQAESANEKPSHQHLSSSNMNVDMNSPKDQLNQRRRHHLKESYRNQNTGSSNYQGSKKATSENAGSNLPSGSNSHAQGKTKRKGGIDTIDMLDVSGAFGPGLYHHDGPFDAANPHRNNTKQPAPVAAFKTEQDLDNVWLGGNFSGNPVETRNNVNHENIWGVHAHEAYTDYSWKCNDESTHSADEDHSLGSPHHTPILQEMRPRAKSADANAAQNGGISRSKSLVARLKAMRANPDSPYLPDAVSDNDASPTDSNQKGDYFMAGQSVSHHARSSSLIRSKSLLNRMRKVKLDENIKGREHDHNEHEIRGAGSSSSSPSSSTPPSPHLSRPHMSLPRPPPLQNDLPFDKTKPLPVPSYADPNQRRLAQPTTPTGATQSNAPVFEFRRKGTDDSIDQGLRTLSDEKKWTAKGRVHTAKKKPDTQESQRGPTTSNKVEDNTKSSDGTLERKPSLLDRVRNVKLVGGR